jgi:hypothetical protein
MLATNLGLSSHDVEVGFTEGSNKPEARRVADQVVKELGDRWRVYTVPAGKGGLCQ